MFILLLLASHVAGEWVEIAQNHYRKEPSRRVTAHEGTSKANRIYINHTITERPWNKGVATRIPNAGNVKRVTLTSKSKDEFTIGKFYDNTEKITDNGDYENFGTVRAPNLKNMKHSETINVNRKNNDDDNTRNRFSVTNDKSIMYAPSQSIRRIQVSPNNTPNVFKQDRKETIEKNKSTLNSRKHTTFGIDHDFTVERNPNIKRVQNVADVDKHDNKKPYSDSRKYLNKNDMNVNTLENLNNIKTEKEHIEVPANIKVHEVKDVSPKSPIIISSKIINDENRGRNISNPTKNPIIDYNANKVNRSNFDKSSVEQIDIENTINNSKNDKFHPEQKTKIENNKTSNNSKKNIEVLWKLMKLITDNMARNTHRSFKSKLKYLEVLRNNILLNIEERIDQAWPDDEQRRRRRAARGHVEFPSSESALMTISFLTFAVFLIKLVLQVIHTYKNKTMMVTPTVVAAVGRAAAALHERTSN